jgi:hypothetical protein
VVLLYYAEDYIAGHSGGEEAARALLAEPGGVARLQQELAELLDPSSPACLPALRRIHSQTGIDPVPLLSSSLYRGRLLDVALERLRVGSDAPSLRLAPHPLQPECDVTAFGLIFGAEAVLFQDTVLALQADGQAEHAPGDARVNVLGVHHTWLDDEMRAHRALVVDRPGRVCEVAFEKPCTLDVVQVLHLARDHEIERHEALSSDLHRAGVPQVNPYALPTQCADNKMLACEAFKRFSGDDVKVLRTPETRLVRRGSTPPDVSAAMLSLLAGSPERLLVAQPAHGTEGRQVEAGWIRANDRNVRAGRHPLVIHAVDEVLTRDDLILRVARGNVRAIEDGQRLPVTFRVNVAWDGQAFVAESGFAQVAEDEQAFAASRGRGGRLVPLDDALRALCYGAGTNWRRIAPSDTDLARIRIASENAMLALNHGVSETDYLQHAGVDLVLEAGESGILPVVLEVNARPAGLAGSRRLPPASGRDQAPMVTHALYKHIRQRHSERSRGR